LFLAEFQLLGEAIQIAVRVGLDAQSHGHKLLCGGVLGGDFDGKLGIGGAGSGFPAWEVTVVLGRGARLLSGRWRLLRGALGQC
jgi:hypothetical protein